MPATISSTIAGTRRPGARPRRKGAAAGAFQGYDSIELRAGDLDATFLPDVGMVGVSLRHAGAELLDRRGGIADYAEQGAVMGLPAAAEKRSPCLERPALGLRRRPGPIAGRRPFACFAPMTAPADPQRGGAGLRHVAPGGSFTAMFSIAVTLSCNARDGAATKTPSDSCTTPEVLMPVHFPRSRGVLRMLALASALVLASTLATSAMATYGARGAVYTQTNDPNGNTIQEFNRAANGSLTPAGTFPTGGVGLAGLGGRQGAVEVSGDGRYLYAVNAGSDSLSVFRVGHRRPELVGSFPTLGSAPVSIEEDRGRVYVLNSGGAPSVVAFWRWFDGSLKPIPGGARTLTPGADGAAQVSITPDRDALVVSERVANRLETLPLDRFGRPGAPVVTASSGAVPFGFGITGRGTIVVSEAGASTVSSYRAGDRGTLRTVTASLTVGQGAACWVAVSPSGRFAYTGNASGSISGFAIGRDGALSALNADGLTAALVPSPRDLDFDASGRYLYAVSPGAPATGGQVTSYRVGLDGSLTLIGSVPAAAEITGAAVS